MFEQVTIEKAFELFLLDCEIRRLKSSTIVFYNQKLQHLFSYCSDNGITYIAEISSKNLRTFSLGLIDQNLSNQYQHNILRAVRTFLRFCCNEGIISEVPRLSFPRLPKEVKKAFTEGEIKTILSQVTNGRDRVICLLLLDTGIRANELINIDIPDVNIKEGTIIIREGKTGQRIVQIGAKVRKTLLLYINNRKRGPLFLAQGKTRFTLSGIMQLMKRLQKRTNIKHCTCHTFRRTFAITCLRNGMNIYVLAKLMGHSDIQVLKRYLDITQDDLAAAHRQFGVVDNI